MHFSTMISNIPAAVPAIRETGHWAATWDDTRLFYRCWQSPTPCGKGIILFHRGHEHSGRFEELARVLAADGWTAFAWDARGHGRSPGRRGHAPSFGALVRDADCFVRHLSVAHSIPVSDMAVVGNSVGSVIAATWVHDYAPPIRALVLGSPALRVRLYVPFALTLLNLLRRFKSDATVKSYVQAKFLTRDRAEIRKYRTDPLITRDIAVNVLTGLRDAAERVTRDAGAIRVPTLMLTAGTDVVVDTARQRHFFAGLSSSVKRHKVLRGFRHDIFHERDRLLPIGETRDFIADAFKQGPVAVPYADGGSEPHTEAEFRRLAAPLPSDSPRSVLYLLVRLALATVGRLSEGIRLGWRYGFDSGPMLDYVYADEARGLTPLGRLIDRIYLDTRGWRGIRRRKSMLEDALAHAIEACRAENGDRPVRIVDPAAGVGRYLLDAIRGLGGAPVEAELRDIDRTSLAIGHRLARSLDVGGVHYVERDAFDAAVAEYDRGSFDIAVVSGLHELVPDNGMVRRSLAQLHGSVRSGGTLVYTNQPWHPQIELIARTLIDRNGERWVMRRRTQVEMDALVAEAGFEKTATRIEEDGMFSVSVARRRIDGC